MNKERRKKLDEAHSFLIQAYGIIEEVQYEEQDAFDNLSEGLQQTEMGQKLEENAYELEDMSSSVDEVMGRLMEMIEG